jgi:hypothetical protein
LSCASTDRPIVDPVTQWLGSGLGQNGSTSKMGARTVAAARAAGVDAAAAASITAKASLDFIVVLLPVASLLRS